MLHLTKEIRTNEFNKLPNTVPESICPLYRTSPPMEAKNDHLNNGQ